MHDLHCHTNLSACAKRESSLSVMLKSLRESGVTIVGIANHLWDSGVPGSSPWYAPQDVPHVLSIRKEYDALPPEEKAGIKIYFGCETEYVGQGRAALREENAALFDFVLVPPHHFHMKNFVRPAELEEPAKVRKLMSERFLECCNIPFAFGLAHPLGVLGYPGRIDEILAGFRDDDYRTLFNYATEKKKSVEINIAILFQEVRRDGDGLPAEYVRMMTVARECGCVFHLGSDAHDPSRLGKERFGFALKFAQKCGIVFPEDPLAAKK